jgi:electron transfer flavoprotein alpha subunit
MSGTCRPGLVVVAHAIQGELAPSAAQLLGLARRLRQDQGQTITALLLGQDLGPAAAQMAGLGLDQVILVEGEGLEAYSGPAWVTALTALLAGLGPLWVLVPHDSQGQDYAPVLSLRLGAACLGGVEGLEMVDERPVFLRAGLGGKLLRRERPLTPSAVITVLPGAFPAAPPQGPPAPMVSLTSPVHAPGLRQLGWRAGQSLSQELGAAQTVVAVGRGLGSRDNLPLAQELASCLGGVLAGSRPVCDLGWLGYGQQVGQTGATVNPRLYLACGISGARQHTLGMQGAGFIVAINTDPQAPMHDLADVSVVADLTAFMPAMLAACRALK